MKSAFRSLRLSVRSPAGMAVLFAAYLVGQRVFAQQVAGASNEVVKFEVASVRPDLTRSIPIPRVRVLPGARTVQAEGFLTHLVSYAFGSDRRVDGSQAILKERFVIVAKIPDSATVTDEVVRRMMQTLLSERFQLRVRFDDELQTVSVMQRVRSDRLGPRLRARINGCSAGDAGDELAQSTVPGSKPRCRLSIVNGHLAGTVEHMSWLAQSLSAHGRRMILDETGLSGAFDVEMTFSPETFSPVPIMPRTAPTSLPTFAEALRDSLGLKMETQQRLVPVIVVERIEPPTEN